MSSLDMRAFAIDPGSFQSRVLIIHSQVGEGIREALKEGND
ncbi:hypothetical protein [Aeromonas aquatica]|nr:hypothetical protein [Aeromonas aquatica]